MLDKRNHWLIIDNKKIDLTTMQVKLYEILENNKNNYVLIEEIAKALYGDIEVDCDVKRAISINICRLRKKDKLIKIRTRREVGYMLEV